jgi:hypothetical protein
MRSLQYITIAVLAGLITLPYLILAEFTKQNYCHIYFMNIKTWVNFIANKKRMRKIILQLLISGFLYSCATQKATLNKPVTGLKFIGEYSLPSLAQFNGTVIGGLSGIDYAPAEDLYYLICDDRSDMIPARFYTAKIYVNEKGIDSINVKSSVTLFQKKW